MVINEIRLNPNHRCFAHILNENGYESSYIGKWHLYAAQLGHHFDVRNSFIPKGPDRLGFDGYFAAYNFHHKYYAPYAYYHLDTPEKIYAEGYEPDFQTDLAIEKIKELAAITGNSYGTIATSISKNRKGFYKILIEEKI